MKEYESMDAVKKEDLTARQTVNAPSGGFGDGTMARGDAPTGSRVLSRIPDVSAEDPESGYRRPFAPQPWRFLNARLSSGLLLGGAVVLFLLALFVFNKKSGSDSAAGDKDPGPSASLPAPNAAPAPKWVGTAPAISPKTAAWGAPSSWPAGSDPVRSGAWGIPSDPRANSDIPATAAWNAPPGAPAAAASTPTSSWRNQSPPPAWDGTPTAVADKPASTAWDNTAIRSPAETPIPAPTWREPAQPPVAVPAQSLLPEAPMVATRPSAQNIPAVPTATEPTAGAVRSWPAPYETYLQPQSGAGRSLTTGDRTTDPAERQAPSPHDSPAAYPSTGSPTTYPAANEQRRIAAPTANPQGVYPQSTYPSASYPSASYPSAGYPSAGYPSAGYPSATGTYRAGNAGAGYPNVYPGSGYPSASPSAAPPTGGREAYPARTYPNSYPTTGAQNAYQATAYPNTYPPTGAQGGYSPGAYPSGYPAPGYPKAGSAGVPPSGPGYGMGASGQGIEPGAAQFQGGIEKPAMRATYDRTGSSVY